MAEAEASHQARGRLLWVVALAYGLGLLAAAAVGLALQDRSPLLVGGLADGAATLVIFGFSVAYDNSSLYDPYWSVAPIPLALYWARPSAPRAMLVLALVSVWGVRLTYNCLARWRSLEDEDFRYAEIRQKAGKLYWPASLVSIHLLPTGWVFAGMLAAYPALRGQGRPLGWIDALGLLVAGGAILIEALADRQLRTFLRTRTDSRRVLDTGLWSISRHPNYLGELVFWWGLWLLGVAADPGARWTALGPASITLLFLFVSVPWMDRRMLARHPDWARQLKEVPALIPFRWPR